MPDDNKDKNNPKVSTAQPKPNKGANGPANGEQPKGTTDPNAGHGATTDVNRNPAAPRTTLVEVHLNDDVRNDPNARVGSPVGPAVGRNKYGGTPGDPWGTRARLDAQRQAQHEKNMQAQAAQRQAWRDSSARVTRDFAAKRQATQDAINSGDFTNLKTISADNWKKLGERNGEIRSSYVKDENGNLVQDGVDENGKPKFKMTYQEGQGSMFDATKGAKDVAALEKWWAEEGVATSRGNIPKGVFDENGRLKTEGLTADQFGALQKIMSNSQERLAPLRERAQMNDHQNYLNASEYLSGKGVKVWDTATGKRLLSRDQVMQMAREMKLGDAKAALEGMAPAWNKANSLQTDSNGNVFTDPKDQEFYQKRAFDEAKAKEAGLVNQLRRLGFRADQIADKDGNIDYGLIASALGGTGTQKAVPEKGSVKGAIPRGGQPKEGEMDALVAGFAAKPSVRSLSDGTKGALPKAKGTAKIPDAPEVEVEFPEGPEAQVPVQKAAPREEPVVEEPVVEEAGDGRKVFRDVYGIPEDQKPFVPSDVLSFKSLDKANNRPSLTPGRGTPLSEELARVRKTVPDGVDPTVHAFQSRGLNPLQTATMIAGAVPAGITQIAGGTTRILSGGDLERGFTDIGLGALAAAGGAAVETTAAGAADRIAAARAARRGGTLPKNRYAGGAMPGSSTVKATARRLEARVAEGEGVINPKSVSQPLGRKETAKVEAEYARGRKMESNVREAKAREAINKFKEDSRLRAEIEREDIRRSHEVGIRAQRAEQRKQVQDRIRRNESKAGYPKPAKKRRHN